MVHRARNRTALLTALSAAATAFVLGAPAAAAPYAPVDQPGPPIDVPVAKLRAALTCSPAVGHSDQQPVLLVPGTGATFKTQFSWNFAIALTKVGIPWCGVSPPQTQLGDIQTAGAYDAYAIRWLYHASGDRRIAVVGHSQGGMQPRWALRFWPDTRAMVADQVGIAPDNQGVSFSGAFPAASDLCNAAGECPMTVYQQASNSNFIKALNSRQQMFGGIDYTVIYSETDGLVPPQDTPLQGAGSYARISLQDICPGHIGDHFQNGTTDPVSWALALDAITHQGPALAARIAPAVCSQLINPLLDPATAILEGAQAAAELASNALRAPFSRGEPPLRCYVFATCTGASVPTLTLRATSRPRRIEAKRRARIRVAVRSDQGGVLVPVPAVTVSLGAKRRTTNRNGRATIFKRFKRAGSYEISATRPGTNPARASIRVRR